VRNRIALVEDHGLIAHTLSAAMRARGGEVVVLDPAEVDDIVGAVASDPVDLVLLDLDLGPQGEATPLIRPLMDTGAHVLMVTGVSDPIRHARCVREGAVGVLSKSVSFDELTDAVEHVLDHGSLLPKPARDELLALLREEEVRDRTRLAPFEQLTPREAEVLGWLMQGLSVQQVAQEAYVSVATVRTQVRSILAKLQASSQVSAIARARDVGWVPPQER
jgi:two-component system, NarL family, nitrate/nitrite response regulator NarL